jgi:O-antigen ligase
MAGFLRTHGARRLFSAVAFVLSGLALLLTFSRAAWLGLAAGLGLVGAWLLITRRSLALLSWAGLCAVSLILMVPLILQYASFLSSRLNLDGSFSAATPENQSVNERWLLLSQAGRLIAAHPLTGVGAGAYPQALRQAEPDYPFAYQPPHMVLAEVTAETGLPGGTLYLSALALPWVLLARGRKTLAFTLSLACASALLLALSVVSFLDYYPWLSSAGSAWQWLAWGAWGGIFAGLPGKGAV